MFLVLKRKIVSIFLFFKKLLETIKTYLAVIKNKIVKPFRKERVIFLIGTPDHGNMGDQLIALGELEWFKKYYTEKVIEYSNDILFKDYKCRELLSRIKKNDLIFLHGGGNLNNKYMKCEKIRRRILQKLPDNEIILFQQSINYDDDEESQKIKEQTSKIYSAHKNLKIFTREQTSYQNAKEMFPDLEVFLLPDMATFLFNKLFPSENFERNGILFCIRNDVEKYYSNEEINSLKNNVSEKYDIFKGDTHIGKSVSIPRRLPEVQNLIDHMAHHKLIITDRFHGVVFSILSKTPCIALKSTDHKIVDGVKWFKNYEGLKYVESTENIEELVDTMYNMNDLSHPEGFDEYFKKMKEMITK